MQTAARCTCGCSLARSSETLVAAAAVAISVGTVRICCPPQTAGAPPLDKMTVLSTMARTMSPPLVVSALAHCYMIEVAPGSSSFAEELLLVLLVLLVLVLLVLLVAPWAARLRALPSPLVSSANSS